MRKGFWLAGLKIRRWTCQLYPSSVVQSRPFDLLVFPSWSTFSRGPKRLTFYKQVLWATEHTPSPLLPSCFASQDEDELRRDSEDLQSLADALQAGGRELESSFLGRRGCSKLKITWVHLFWEVGALFWVVTKETHRRTNRYHHLWVLCFETHPDPHQGPASGTIFSDSFHRSSEWEEPQTDRVETDSCVAWREPPESEIFTVCRSHVEKDITNLNHIPQGSRCFLGPQTGLFSRAPENSGFFVGGPGVCIGGVMSLKASWPAPVLPAVSAGVELGPGAHVGDSELGNGGGCVGRCLGHVVVCWMFLWDVFECF